MDRSTQTNPPDDSPDSQKGGDNKESTTKRKEEKPIWAESSDDETDSSERQETNAIRAKMRAMLKDKFDKDEARYEARAAAAASEDASKAKSGSASKAKSKSKSKPRSGSASTSHQESGGSLIAQAEARVTASAVASGVLHPNLGLLRDRLCPQESPHLQAPPPSKNDSWSKFARDMNDSESPMQNALRSAEELTAEGVMPGNISNADNAATSYSEDLSVARKAEIDQQESLRRRDAQMRQLLARRDSMHQDAWAAQQEHYKRRDTVQNPLENMASGPEDQQYQMMQQQLSAFDGQRIAVIRQYVDAKRPGYTSVAPFLQTHPNHPNHFLPPHEAIIAGKQEMQARREDMRRIAQLYALDPSLVEKVQQFDVLMYEYYALYERMQKISGDRARLFNSDQRLSYLLGGGEKRKSRYPAAFQ